MNVPQKLQEQTVCMLVSLQRGHRLTGQPVIQKMKTPPPFGGRGSVSNEESRLIGQFARCHSGSILMRFSRIPDNPNVVDRQAART
jgi:hypothetical protein